jgi:hypothetical protein
VPGNEAIGAAHNTTRLRRVVPPTGGSDDMVRFRHWRPPWHDGMMRARRYFSQSAALNDAFWLRIGEYRTGLWSIPQISTERDVCGCLPDVKRRAASAITAQGRSSRRVPTSNPHGRR